MQPSLQGRTYQLVQGRCLTENIIDAILMENKETRLLSSWRKMTDRLRRHLKYEVGVCETGPTLLAAKILLPYYTGIVLSPKLGQFDIPSSGETATHLSWPICEPYTAVRTNQVISSGY